YESSIGQQQFGPNGPEDDTGQPAAVLRLQINVSIRPLLRDGDFTPEDMTVLIAAFARAALQFRSLSHSETLGDQTPCSDQAWKTVTKRACAARTADFQLDFPAMKSVH